MYERRAIMALESAGYSVTKAAASLGVFDLIAIGPVDIRLVQVKGGRCPWCGPAEREAIASFVAPANCSREVWKYYHGKRGGAIIDHIAPGGMHAQENGKTDGEESAQDRAEGRALVERP
jgi:hypothetical protein